MIIVPETPITDASFNKWKAHRIDFEEGEAAFYYYIIPLIDIDESELDNIEEIPALFSSESDEFQDENGNSVFTMRLFDEDMPELTSEEEIEILYKILTKKELFLK
jgi:hypothetical protein